MEDLKKFSQYGIMVAGFTIVGFDHDDLSIFQKQFDFFMQTGIPEVYVYPLQAYDGTRPKERMIAENRYIEYQSDGEDSENLKYGTLENFTIIPKQMTLEQLKGGRFLVGLESLQT